MTTTVDDPFTTFDMGALFSLIVDYATPAFLVLSPIISYSDQILSIHRSKSSSGFSLDIPLIMLVASIFKVFYWFGAHYAYSLLFQAIFTIGVQVILLKVALDNRPPIGIRDGVEHMPFSGQSGSASSNEWGFVRPYQFWQWRNARPYWQFLAYLTFALSVVHILLPPVSRSESYISLLGAVGLAVEAVLPIPQILSNHRNRSCRGFRFSVLASWLVGDMFKIFFLFFSTSNVTWAFRLCGVFQCACDCFLGLQYWFFGDRAPVPVIVKQDGAAVRSWEMR